MYRSEEKKKQRAVIKKSKLAYKLIPLAKQCHFFYYQQFTLVLTEKVL